MDTFRDISVLPVEVLENIFLYLSVNDKLSVSLVSKQWLNVMNQPILLKNIRVYLNSHNSTDAIHLTFTRNFSDITFCNLDITQEYINFFLQHGNHIRCLTFRNCSMELKVEAECKKLTICPSLRALEFWDCFLNIFLHLPHLENLCIDSENSYIISDCALFTFQKTMPKLKTFVLHHPAASLKVVIKRFYPNVEDWTKMPSNLILSLRAVQDFVHRRSKTLTHLSIRNKEIQPKNAMSLLKSGHLKLKSLFMNEWFECVNIVPEICRSQTSLTELDLTSLQVSDASIKLICSILPSLKAFIMQNNLLLDSSIVEIFQLKYLQILCLESCSNIRLESYNNALNVFKLYDLRSLDISSTKSNDKCVRSILKLTPKLRYLNLSSCLDISDETVHTISENLILLRFLSLSGCKNVTDQGLRNPKTCLSNIKGLLELHLRMCPKITTSGLLESIKFLELRSLHLQNNNNNYDLVNVIQQLKTQNPSLRFDALYSARYIFSPSHFVVY